MSGFLDGIKNGFASAQNIFSSFVTDSRATNDGRPRVQSQDPTRAIDKSENIPILNFPIDRPKYYITFGFEEYRRPSQFEGLTSKGITDYICLPMPNNLQDNNTLNYNEQGGSLIMEAVALGSRQVSNGIQNALATGGTDGLKKAFGDVVDTASSAAIGSGIRAAVDVARGLEGKSSTGAQGTVDGLLQVGGLADNPFNTIAFSGPAFKQHHFMWRLSPKSQSETEVIKKIVGTFKKAAYPELLTMSAGGFFKYPNIVFPKFQPDRTKNYLYEFKPCVITSINMNYSPSDRPGFFADSSAPIEVVLEITLLEIEIWRNGDEHSIENHQLPTIKSSDFDGVEGAPLTVRDVG